MTGYTYTCRRCGFPYWEEFERTEHDAWRCEPRCVECADRQHVYWEALLDDGSGYCRVMSAYDYVLDALGADDDASDPDDPWAEPVWVRLPPLTVSLAEAAAPHDPDDVWTARCAIKRRGRVSFYVFWEPRLAWRP